MYRSIWAPLASAAAVTVAAATIDSRALAQVMDAKAPLPKVTVEQSETPVPTKPTKKKTMGKAKQPAAIATAPPNSAVAGQTSGAGAIPDGVPASRAGSLTSPNTAEARAEIDRTPGAVELVPDTAYKASTPSATIKDALDYVPGVFAQPKWGDDTRLSIRGSGLSRNFHLRGLQLYMDGIPINTADGFGDFQEIDPTAYRYIEVYKGANALRFGANSLGGAINFVMPAGYDFELVWRARGPRQLRIPQARRQLGRSVRSGRLFHHRDGPGARRFREHSWGESARGSFDLGYRLSEDTETRVYLNANWVRQRIPGEVTKLSALTSPQTADPLHATNDWQRNIDTLRVADKTAVRLGPGTLLEVGAFSVDRHLMHPIFLWLDYTYDDYGRFAKLSDVHLVDGHKNRLIAGVNLLNGNTDAKMFGIGPDAAKLNLLSKLDQTARNFTFYAEDSSDLAPGVALVAGTNYLHAVRKQGVVFSLIGDQAGGQTFDLWSPKLGLLWDVDPGWQVFANANKSAEIPSFDENQIGNPILTAQAQEAVTYEIGTRGRRTDYSWDLAVYRANIDHELQCLNANLGSFCQVVNANETVHQGIEANSAPPSGSRSSSRAGTPTSCGSTRPTRSATSASTTTRPSATTRSRARRGTTCAPSCCTSTRRASISAPTSNGCRRPITSTTPTPSKARGTRSGAPRPASTTAAVGAPTSKAATYPTRPTSPPRVSLVTQPAPICRCSTPAAAARFTAAFNTAGKLRNNRSRTGKP